MWGPLPFSEPPCSLMAPRRVLSRGKDGGFSHSTSFDLIIPAPVPAGLFSLSVAESQAPGGIISLRCWYPRPGRADVITPVLQVKKDFLELSGLFKVTGTEPELQS